MNNNQDNFNYNPQMNATNNQNPLIKNQSRFFQNVNQPEKELPKQEPINSQVAFSQNFNQGFNQVPVNSNIQPSTIQNQNNTINTTNYLNQNVNNNNLNNNTNLVNNSNPYFNNLNNTPNIDNNINQNLNTNTNNNNLNININNNNNFTNVFSESNDKPDNGIEDEYAFLNPQSQNKYINDNIDTSSTELKELKLDEGVPRVDYSMDPKVQENLGRDEKRNKTITITTEMKVFLLIFIVLFISILIIPQIFDYFINN